MIKIKSNLYHATPPDYTLVLPPSTLHYAGTAICISSTLTPALYEECTQSEDGNAGYDGMRRPMGRGSYREGEEEGIEGNGKKYRDNETRFIILK